MSIMSISMDYDDLFDQEKGIYVKGNIFKEKFSEESGRFYNGQDISDTCRKLDANYNQRGKEWERAAHIDYIESDGTTTECNRTVVSVFREITRVPICKKDFVCMQERNMARRTLSITFLVTTH